ncbi:hypothetical protein ACJJIE_21630 [Microbulbifer sp. TRSA001]|uniref:hypothetical protein n=1 Tax=Microbulbifer sp. TRSA001 TaxID=3243381 RepID=UPI004039CDC6
MKKSYSYSPANGKGQPDGEYSIVVSDGTRKLVLPGDELRHEYSCGDLTLLISSYDYYDGVSYWYSLLGKNGSIIDRVSTSDRFGFIEDLTVEGEDLLEFGIFDSNERWRLRICELGFRSFSWEAIFQREPKFWFRRHYLKLEKV